MKFLSIYKTMPKQLLFLVFIFSCSEKLYLGKENIRVPSDFSGVKEMFTLQVIFPKTIFPDPKNFDEKYFIERIKQKLLDNKLLKEEKLLQYYFTLKLSLEEQFGIRFRKIENIDKILHNSGFSEYPHLEDTVDLFPIVPFLNYDTYELSHSDTEFRQRLSKLCKDLKLDGVLYQMHIFEIDKLNPEEESFEISYISLKIIHSSFGEHTYIGLKSLPKRINLDEYQDSFTYDEAELKSIGLFVEKFGINEKEYFESKKSFLNW
jgi:hypothetical protein